MTEQKSNKKNNYVTTVRQGAIAANIFRGVTNDGHAYLYFSLSRSWKTPKGRTGYSDRMYAGNREALMNVVEQAAEWIEQNPQAADSEVEAREMNSYELLNRPTQSDPEDEDEILLPQIADHRDG